MDFCRHFVMAQCGYHHMENKWFFKAQNCPIVRWKMRNLKYNQKVTGLICRLNITLQSVIMTFPRWLCVLHNPLHTPTCFYPHSQNHVASGEMCFFLCMEDMWIWISGHFAHFVEFPETQAGCFLSLLFTRISWSSSSSHSSGSFPHLSLVFWGNTHHQRSPWMKRFSINQLTPDLRSNQVISPVLFSPSPSLSTDKSPHRKSDSLFQFINDAHLPFISSTSTDWFGSV